MSLITRLYSFTDGQTAYGSQVDAEIANIVNAINNLDAASTTWTNVKVTTFLPQAAFDMGGHKITGLANGSDAQDAATYSQVSAIAGAITGSLLMYPLKASPSGYLYCDGSAVARGTYTALFSAIGVIFGSGDGATTFNLPDYRGKFIRGVDDGAGNDPNASSRTAQASGGNSGDAAGSCQAGANASHTHTATVTDPGHNHTEKLTLTNGGASIAPGRDANVDTIGSATITTASNNTGVTVSNSSTGGSESRPINSAIYFHIKI